MKKSLILLCLVIPICSAQAQLKLPRESQYSELIQQIGFTEVKVSYTRPNMKNRTIFGAGEMVPYGQVWRTGANSSTKLTTDKDIYLEGHKIPAGKYALYSIPNKDEWTIIISNDTTLWGHYGYKEEHDFLRFKVKSSTTGDHHETMLIAFEGVNQTQATLQITWGRHIIPIEFRIDEAGQDAQIMADIKKTLALPDNRDEAIVVAHDYFHAAQYYNDTDRDLEQAVKWFNKAIEIEDVSYFHLYKSDALGKLKRYDEAIEASEDGLAIFMRKATNKEWIWRYEQQIEKWKKLKKGS